MTRAPQLAARAALPAVTASALDALLVPPLAAAGSKPVVRTVSTFVASPVCTVAIALPA